MKTKEEILKEWRDSMPERETDENGFYDNFYWPTEGQLLRLIEASQAAGRVEAEAELIRNSGKYIDKAYAAGMEEAASLEDSCFTASELAQLIRARAKEIGK